MPEIGLLQGALDQFKFCEDMSPADSEDNLEGKGLDVDVELPPVAPSPPSGDPNEKKAMSKFTQERHWDQYRAEGLRGYFVCNPNCISVTAHCRNRKHGPNCRATMTFRKKNMGHGLSVALAPGISR